MEHEHEIQPAVVLHWNYRGFTEFPLSQLKGEENVTDIYLKENLISRLPNDIDRLQKLESLYLSGNDITELPVGISKLRHLKCLDVSGNRLRRVPEEIGDLRCLKYLILDDNELRDLPLRLAELRSLRYLSVCDNKLKWLPQRPVYNYYHCEFRFWRNTDLKTIPYSLWYHMLKDQQTRSLNIGCLQIPQFQFALPNGRCRLKLQHNSRTWEVDIELPYDYLNVKERDGNSPPSLLELCKREVYQNICDTAKSKSDDGHYSIYADYTHERNSNNDNRVEEINNNNIVNFNAIVNLNKETQNNSKVDGQCRERVKKWYYVPTDVIEEYYDYLPKFIKKELCKGPISRCENVKCKKPIFDFVTFEFCIGKIVLIDETDDVILSAAFCSQQCANVWRGGKTNIILTWKLI